MQLPRVAGRVLLALDGPTVRVLKADDLAQIGVFGAPNLTVAAAVATVGERSRRHM